MRASTGRRSGAHFTTLVDTIGPRLAGSPEYKRAADWSRETLAKWGLTGARLEAFEFGRGWQLEKFTLEMVEPRYMPLMGTRKRGVPPPRAR